MLRNTLTRESERYRNDLPSAKKLLQAGASPRDASLSPIEHAAWTIVASVLLNLSETVTKS